MTAVEEFRKGEKRKSFGGETFNCCALSYGMRDLFIG